MTATSSLVDRYFMAADDHDVDALTNLFTTDGVVIDEGQARRGRAEIRTWQDHAASDFEYTTTELGRQSDDDDSCVVTMRLEGNFPGGTADLRFDFRTADGLITQLTIAP